jgi:hypothetical protein
MKYKVGILAKKGSELYKEIEIDAPNLEAAKDLAYKN